VKRKKRKEKRWEEINISKVVEIRSLNLDLDLLWKDLRVKHGEIIEHYKTLLFSNFQKKKICFVKVMSFWRLCVRSGFLVISPLFELFCICSWSSINVNSMKYICFALNSYLHNDLHSLSNDFLSCFKMNIIWDIHKWKFSLVGFPWFSWVIVVLLTNYEGFLHTLQFEDI
jgi:hypothetical protein